MVVSKEELVALLQNEVRLLRCMQCALQRVSFLLCPCLRPYG